MSPVLRRMTRSSLRARSRSQMPAVRRSCQTIALQIGSPVTRSQTTVVSRWFVIPIAATSVGDTLAFVNASAATPACDDQMSRGLCSTHPGLGKICGNSFCATATIEPA